MEFKCGKCGSDDVFTRHSGHPDTKGKVEALCGACGHRATIREWDFDRQPKAWQYNPKDQKARVF